METSTTSIRELPLSDQQFIQNIIDGKAIPPLYSDVIAKRIFNPDVHPDRLNFLMRRIAQDDTIDVASSAGNESYKQSVWSKSMITDIPSWLRDGRAGDLEIQKVKQNFIFTRVELYASEMLLLQYSVREGDNKGSLDYENLKEILIIILMVESPRAFRDYKCDNYIHRFTKMTADTGLSYPTKAKMIYVQLDKCLAQFRTGKNGERDDELQLWLSMIADVNDPKVASEADKTLAEIMKEAADMAQDKGVQNMLIQEKLDRMDWVSYGNEKMKEGLQEGLQTGLSIGEIRGAIKTYRKIGKTPSEIAEHILCDFNLSQADAERYVNETLELKMA